VTVKRAREDSERLADAVYEQLKADIFDFRRLPGVGLSENEIAARTGVSRTPVREALLRLQREGFVERQPKIGWSVRPLDFERFESLYDLRVILELAALAKLCAGAIGGAIDRLKAVWLAPKKQRASDPVEVARLDEAFHASLVQAAGNPELARVHGDITERIRIIRRLDFTQPERVERTYEEHAAVLRAVLARNPEQAGALLRAHIEQSKLAVREISLHRLHRAHVAARSRNG
jgi:DNA-binding GntR family transcriptional regulator